MKITNPFKMFQKKNLKEGDSTTVDYTERAKRSSNIRSEYNPDQLAQRHGGIKLYKTMHRDDKLRGVHDFICKAVGAVDWDIMPYDGGKDPVDVEIAKFVKDNYDKCEISIKDVNSNLLDGRYMGFKVAEKIWEMRGTDICLKNIKCKNSEDFDFDTDEYSNIKPDGLIQKNREDGTQRLDSKKFVIYVHPYLKDGNWYGESEYESVYREWYFKDVAKKMRNQAIQGYGEPIRDVIYDADKFSGTKLDNLKSIVNDLYSNLAIYRPGKWDKDKGVWIPYCEIKLLESARKTSEEFNAAIEQENTAMARRLLIGDKLGQTDSKGGSYALGEVHLELFWYVLKEVFAKLEDIHNAQVIKQMVDLNWPGRNKYPRKKFHTLDDSITKEKMEIVKLGIDAGLIDPLEDWVRPYLNLPKIDLETQAKIDAKKAEKEAMIREAQKAVAGKGRQGPDEDKPLKNYKQTYRDYTNYKAVEKDLDSMESEAVPELSKVFEDIRQDIIWQAQKIVDSGKTRFEIDIKTKHKSAMKEVLELTFMDTMFKAKRSAIDTIKEAQKNLKYTLKIKKENENYEIIPIKIRGGSTEYIEKNYADKFTYQDRFLRNKQKQRAFYITGVESDAILGKVNRILTEGIGKLDVKKITAQIDEVFNQYLETGEIDGKTAEPARVNTIIRTNTTRVFNEARLSTFEDPDLNNFTKAFGYSSIIDGRETPFCRFHNGQVVRAGDPRLYVLCPSHFNCRSLWTPIFAGEDFETDWYDKSGVEPGDGFGL